MPRLISPFLILAFGLFGFGCQHDQDSSDRKSGLFCSAACKATNANGVLACKMTTAELQERKESVIARLTSQILETKELDDGFAFKFPGTDRMLDELTEFIKTERECCDFFVFDLSVSGDKGEIWLALTGVKGVKEFIRTELGW